MTAQLTVLRQRVGFNLINNRYLIRIKCCLMLDTGSLIYYFDSSTFYTDEKKEILRLLKQCEAWFDGKYPNWRKLSRPPITKTESLPTYLL